MFVKSFEHVIAFSSALFVSFASFVPLIPSVPSIALFVYFSPGLFVSDVKYIWYGLSFPYRMKGASVMSGTSIAICIGKGGQAKTTTACSMSWLLNEAGKRTIVVDCDPQCNATVLFGGAVENAATLYDCWIEARHPVPVMDCIQHTDKGDIVAGDSLISEITGRIYDGTLTLSTLKERVIEPLKERYDYVLLDCPPDLTGFINRSVITSVDELLVTLKGDRLSVKGLSDIYKVIVNVKQTVNPNIVINGMLLTNFQRNTKNGQNALRNAKAIAKELGTVLYASKIRYCAKGQEAIDKADFVVRYAPNCTSSIDYRAFVTEFLEKEAGYGEE